MSKKQQNLKQRDATELQRIKSLLDSVKSAKKLFVLIIRLRQKQSNVDLELAT